MNNLRGLTQLIRYYILRSTTQAESGHPSSSLSAVELMTALMFGGTFRADLEHPEYPNNDRLIFSKGHAAPLLYSLYAAAGKVSEEELSTLRQFGSRLEGHPTLEFPYTEAPTGSLGQGLGIGVGMALNAKYLDKLPYRTFVLLGDSEMAEGSVWESLSIASYYKLGNLVGILDVNRLGQRGPTMLEHDLDTYERRIASFGWKTVVVDGHSLDEICEAYTHIQETPDQPLMIIAKTLKGKGVSFIEDKNGWHGKPLSQEECDRALTELGDVDKTLRGTVAKPENNESRIKNQESRIEQDHYPALIYDQSKPVATRKAYGNALVRLIPSHPSLVVLDAEVSNSTYAEFVKKDHAEKFFEMFVAEQNMVETALGLSRRGKKPCVSTFAAFLSRAFDQIRMCQYSDANILFCGSHAGVSIGEDGASQMGLEDIAMFRTLLGSTVLYPSDAVSAEKLVEEATMHHGVTYLRTTRKEAPVIYSDSEKFPIGGCKVLRESNDDKVTIVGAGVTLHEALAAYELLKQEGVAVRVIDLYSIKPIDQETLQKAARETKAIITVEDHYAQGGLGGAVRSAFSNMPVSLIKLAVRKMPRTGKPQELLEYEEISASAIVKAVKNLL